MTNLTTATALVAAIEAGAVGERLRPYFHPDAEQVEHPSPITPLGRTRELAAMLAASVEGAELMASQRYEVTWEAELGDRVVLQLEWTGVLAKALGALPAGHELRADVAMFLTFDEAGLIIRQETYDCYRPLAA
ncbi:nuclear transport factor 2 family protein [Microlunatus sp. GCM10028923]|uniref:nuclear transport factor 2 family protein n=1 Tax=Microlunatus sp. GCM10028923 TaxID=3273400 RepID=UPI0036104198